MAAVRLEADPGADPWLLSPAVPAHPPVQACPGRHPVLSSLRTGAQPQVAESPAGLPPCLQLVLSWGPLAYLVTRCLEAVGSVVWSHVDLTVAPPSPHAITGLQDTLPYTHRGAWTCFPLKPRGHGHGNQDGQRASGPRSDFAEAERGNAASARAGAPGSRSHAVGTLGSQASVQVMQPPGR